MVTEARDRGGIEGLEAMAGLIGQTGLKTAIQYVERVDLMEAQKCVLVSPDGRGWCLIVPSFLDGDRQIIPFGYVVSDAGQFKSYSGRLILIEQKAAASEVGTEHMKYGHRLDWFWAPVVKYWRGFSEVIIATLFINLLALAIPLYTLNVYDRVVINFSQDTLIVLTSGVIFALLFDFLFKTIRSYVLERVAEDVGKKYDFALMERFLNLKGAGNLLSIGEQASVFRELQGIREFYTSRLAPAFADLPFSLLFIFIIYLLSPPLALVPICVSVLVVLANWAVHIPVKRLTEQYFVSNQTKTSALIELLGGIQTLKIFNAKGDGLFRWLSVTGQTARATRLNHFLMSMVGNFSMLLSQSGHVLVIFFGVYQIQQGNLTIGGLIACTILASRAMAPVINVSSNIARIRQCNDVLQAIDNVYKLPSEEDEDSGKAEKGPFDGNIGLLDVSFIYQSQERPALENITLEIPAKQKIGMIGKTAAGKSTLARLIAGILTPGSGEITLDGYQYSAIPVSELRRTVAYVPQEPYIFRGTIKRNIILGRHNVTDEDFERAVRLSGLDIVTEQTGQGFDMEVGENGDRLSGGQRQAISLARALVSDPAVIVFDEPTTGMDSALEQRVKTELAEYIQSKTFIMITHRTPLLSLVDRIVFLDKGRIVADGPRDEILAKLSA